MSTTVDERVVSMQFDNKQFEANVQETVSTLDRLKQKLNLTGAAKGLENVDAAAKGVDMSPLARATEAIGVKFSALQVAAVTALANITNSAVNAGKRLVSAFTIDPIKTGLQEYETQINAVQTILANTESKGTTLDDVNKALDQLNTYADKTIYNFTEMTRNIGTFTAAGIDLDTSVNAIQGIANLAAVSGSTSQQASTAMYQLSQALASGTVKLMDWNSVVNAGMGGQVFQDALKETARVHGISIDDMIESEGSFRETLKEGWLTSEILTETLQKFTLATEGLTEEQIEQNRAMLKSKGYTDEQIDGIFKLGNTATNAATKVKTFTQLMDTLKESAQSGWTQTWEILIGDFEQAKELWTSVSDIFSKIIGDASEARNTMLQGWADGGGRDMALEAIKNTWEAIIGIVKPIKEAFREIFPRTTAKQLLKITEVIRDFTKKLILSDEASEKLKSTFKGIFGILDIGLSVVKEVITAAVKLFGSLFGISGNLLDITGTFGDWISKLRDSVKESGVFATAIDKITGILQKLIDKIKEVIGFVTKKIVSPGFEGFFSLVSGILNVVMLVGEKIVSVASTIGKGLANAFRQGDIEAALGVANGAIFTSILVGIKKFLGGFGDSIKGLSGIGGNLVGILDSVKGCFQAWQESLKADILKKIAIAIAILAASIFLIALIDPDRLSDALGAISMLFVDLLAAASLFEKISGPLKGATKTISMMIGMSAAVLILSVALKAIGNLNTEQLLTGLVGVAGLMAILIATAKILGSGKEAKTLVKGAGQMLLMAVAVGVLSGALTVVAKLNWGDLAKGMLGLTGMLAILVGAAKIIESNGSTIIKGAGQMLVMAVALNAMAIALKVTSSMSWEEIIRGLTGILGVTTILIVMASILRTDGSSIVKGAGQMLVMALALNAMALALKATGGMSWEEIAKGLIALGGSLLILAIGLKMMTGTLSGSAALIIAAAAIAILTPALLILSTISWEGIVKGLVAIAASFVMLGVAGAVLGPLVPAIIGLSIALALVGVGVLALGAGIFMLATGITALAAAFATGTIAIVTGIKAIIEGIIGLIPSIIAAIGQGIILICDTIANSVTSITGAITAIITSLVQALEKCIPQIVDVVFKLLDAVLAKLVEFTPKIVSAVFNILIACLNGIAEGLPLVVEAAVNIIVKFLEGIGEQIPRIIQAGVELIVALVQGIADSVLYVINAAIDIAIAFVQGISDSLGRIIQAGWDLIVNFIDGMTESIETNVPRVLAAIGRLFKAIINEAVRILTLGIVDLNGCGKNLIEGFGNGIKSALSGLWDKVKSGFKRFGEKVKNFFGIHSPSTVFMGYGEYLGEGLAIGLNNYSDKVSEAAEDVGKNSVDSLSNAISGISDAINSDIDSQPTIKPVLDLSEIQNGAKQINGMFGMQPSVDVMSNVGSISSSMNSRVGSDNDILSAIKDLGKMISESSGDTYIIDGITYDDGSAIQEAIQTIVRAARIERRA